MANPEHLEILKQGVQIWNRWREENPDIRPDLSEMNLIGANFNGADLSHADLTGTYLGGADLNGVNLNRADLNGADLIGANLIGADLSEASLVRTDLIGSDLSKANLHRAKLTNAKLSGAILSEVNLSESDLIQADLTEVDLSKADLSEAYLWKTDLSQARVGWTKFGDIDLSETKGLETLEHIGPSTIGIDTIYHSNGDIPEIFLRGAGVPDTFITYIASLVEKPIQYYSCFISFSQKDDSFAQRLHADLQQKGVRCWFAPEDMKIGDKIRPAIDQSIRIHDKLLLILSENSLNSFWVESEVEKAFEEERQRKQTVLFPIRLDDAVMKTNQAWATEIRRTRHIGDFCRWKDHDAYQHAFERLLRDLKAEG
jgi:hypothetical protein